MTYVLLAVRVSRALRNEVKSVAAQCDTTMEAYVVNAVTKAIMESRQRLAKRQPVTEGMSR